jgi:hypothetical protein
LLPGLAALAEITFVAGTGVEANAHSHQAMPGDA